MTLKDSWLSELCTLADAYAPQPPTPYLVDGLLPLPSLSILYGSPGCLKSLLLSDLAVCVSSGLPWLSPPPHDPSGVVQPFTTHPAPALWLDFDNGQRRTTNRLAALGRGHGIQTAPLYYLALPSALFDASKTGAIVAMIDLASELGALLVVIDNLLSISSARDENSPEFFPVMSNLRLLAERTGAAVVAIHHSRKESGFRGKQGDDLRGHSSIRGAIDLALLVEREPMTDIVNIRSTKSRDIDIEPFAALWTYQHRPGTNDLASARFFGQRVLGGETTRDIELAIYAALQQAGGPLSQSNLVNRVKASGLKAGRDRIRAIAERMAQSAQLKTSAGSRGAILYDI